MKYDIERGLEIARAALAEKQAEQQAEAQRQEAADADRVQHYVPMLNAVKELVDEHTAGWSVTTGGPSDFLISISASPGGLRVKHKGGDAFQLEAKDDLIRQYMLANDGRASGADSWKLICRWIGANATLK